MLRRHPTRHYGNRAKPVQHQIRVMICILSLTPSMSPNSLQSGHGRLPSSSYEQSPINQSPINSFLIRHMVDSETGPKLFDLCSASSMVSLSLQESKWNRSPLTAYNNCVTDFLEANQGVVCWGNDRAFDARAGHFASWLSTTGYDFNAARLSIDDNADEKVLDGPYTLTIQVWPDAFALTLMAKDVTVTGETETELEVTLQANRSVIEQCYSQDSFNITLHCNIQEQSSNATVKVKRTWNRTQTPGLSKDSSRLSIMTSFMPTKLLSIIGIIFCQERFSRSQI